MNAQGPRTLVCTINSHHMHFGFCLLSQQIVKCEERSEMQHNSYANKGKTRDEFSRIEHDPLSETSNQSSSLLCVHHKFSSKWISL